MNLKDWFKSKPYWLKGGIIGVVFILIFTILFYIYAFLPVSKGYFWEIISTPFIAPTLYIFGILFKITGKADFDLIPGGGIVSTILSTTLFILLVFLFYFLIGCLIGWITGKIKSKK